MMKREYRRSQSALLRTDHAILAWKNIDADYYGFCHYRRYFDFSDTPHEENPYGEIMDDYIDAAAAKKYGLDDENIANVVKQYDVITTPFGNLEKSSISTALHARCGKPLPCCMTMI